MTINEFWAARPNALPYWRRSQAKSLYKLYANLRFDIGYARSKELALFGGEPTSSEEAAFSALADWYLASLENKVQVKIGPNGPAVKFPAFPFSETTTVLEVCEAAVCFAWAQTDDLIIGTCLVDLGLNAMGLCPAVHRRRTRYDYHDPQQVLLCLLSSSWIAKDDACIPKVFSSEDLVLALRKILSPLPIAKAYLYGSYAQGTQLPGSDIDLAVVLEEGLTTSEKGETIACVSRAIRTELGVLPDVKDLVISGEAYVKSHLSIYLEVL